MRNYIITTQTSVRCLVRHFSERAALRAWTGEDVRSIEPATRSEARQIAQSGEHDYRDLPRYEIREPGMPRWSTARTLRDAQADLRAARAAGLVRATVVDRMA